MINVFSSFWHNETSNILPDIVVTSIKSFLIQNIEYHLYTYKNYINIPKECIVEDANSIIPYNEFFIHKCGSYAPFSDYFRIKLINKKDTAWTDTDNIYLKHNVYLDDTKIFAIIQNNRIQNSIFYFNNEPIQKQIKNLLYSFYQNPVKIQLFDTKKVQIAKLKYLKPLLLNQNIKQILPWTYPGSELYTNIFKYLNILESSYEYSKYFNPYHFTQQYKLYTRDISEIDISQFKNVGILILSTDLLRREPDIMKNYHHNSYIANLIKNIDLQYNLKFNN